MKKTLRRGKKIMDRVNKIEKQIKMLKEQRSSVSGKETEVYTRIVGYYRAVKNWNKGKREEYNHRQCFSSLDHSSEGRKIVAESKVITFNEAEAKNRENIVSYAYFYRKTCPNCPAVKNYIENIQLPGEFIDVDSEKGLEAAKINEVFSVPTVIFSNNKGKEVARGRDVQEVKNIVPAELVKAV